MRLTKTVVDRARYQGDPCVDANGKEQWPRCVIWDDALPNFGVRIHPPRPNGKSRKTFIVHYRIGARSRQMTVGAYGPLTLQEARQKAKKVFARVSDEVDPLEERRAERLGETVNDLAASYLERHAIPEKKPSSIRNDKQLLRTYIQPAFGSLKTKDVTTEHVERLKRRLRSKPYTANRTLALLSKMMSLAERWKIRPLNSNPCRHVRRYKEKKRKRYLSPDELARVAQALRKVSEEGAVSQEGIVGLRLLLFTGCRVSEILSLRWDQIDFERRLISFEDTKTGEQEFPLNPAVVEVLAGLSRSGTNPYVLPGREEGSHITELRRAWIRVRDEADLVDVRIHDLRHSFASVGVGLGLGLPMIGALLGHREMRTTARYAHLDNDPQQRASEAIAEAIKAMMAGDEADVVPFPNRAS